MSDGLHLTVNGEAIVAHDVERWTLADVLRDRLGSTGTNVGCEHGICGACTVLIDGLPARSCLILAAQAEGSEIETIEGLGDRDDPHPLQVAFSEERALQCGFCTPGFIMLAEGMLRDGQDDVDEICASNLCRCAGYGGIRTAIGRYRDQQPFPGGRP